jgi:TolA-binding protein
VRRAVGALALLLALSGGVQHAGAEPDPIAARFDAAIALEGQGKFAEAVDALDAFAHEHADHPLAPDALAEVASLAESRLHDPARALTAWRALAEHYPHSRGARRAVVRRAELERLLGGGTDAHALGEYQRLIDEAGVPARAEARAAVRAFLAAHPGFPLTGAGQYWLGQTAEQSSANEEALRDYEAAIALGGEAAPRAARAKGELLLRLGRLREAGAAFDALAAYSDAASQQARAAGTAAVRAQRARARWASFALIALVLAWVGGALWARRALWPPPLEVRFFIPVALLFGAAALSEHRAIARTVGIIGLGSSIALWIAGALRARLGERILGKLVLALSAGAAVVAVSYLAVYWNGLTDLVLETWRAGPDR